MASKAHGKSMVYLSPTTKGSLIELIHKLHQLPETRELLSKSKKHFLTYDQAVNWLLEHHTKIDQ